MKKSMQERVEEKRNGIEEKKQEVEKRKKIKEKARKRDERLKPKLLREYSKSREAKQGLEELLNAIQHLAQFRFKYNIFSRYIGHKKTGMIKVVKRKTRTDHEVNGEYGYHRLQKVGDNRDYSKDIFLRIFHWKILLQHCFVQYGVDEYYGDDYNTGKIKVASGYKPFEIRIEKNVQTGETHVFIPGLDRSMSVDKAEDFIIDLIMQAEDFLAS